MSGEKIDEKRLAEIEARATAATPGPWRVSFDNSVRSLRARPAKNVSSKANAHFIAAARADIPDLIADLRAAKAEIAQIRADLDEIEAAEKHKLEVRSAHRIEGQAHVVLVAMRVAEATPTESAQYNVDFQVGVLADLLGVPGTKASDRAHFRGEAAAEPCPTEPGHAPQA